MKLLRPFVPFLAFGCLCLSACDENPATPCRKSANLVAYWTSQACSGKYGCCLCECWNQGRKVVDDPVACTCKAADPVPVTCEGDELAAANACLEDQTACQAEIDAAVEAGCVSGGNECEQAFAVFAGAFDSACLPVTDCCLCDCWKDGQKLVDDPDTCTCIDRDPLPEVCEGADLEAAQACLADTTACAAAIQTVVSGSCGDLNECQQAAAIAAGAFDSACLAVTGCCVCDCWNDGKKVVDEPDPCTCTDPDPPPDPCEGTDLEQAQTCLADTTACAAAIQSIVDASCSGGDECEQAFAIKVGAYDQACTDKSDVCCFCQCWNDGHKDFDTAAYSQDQSCICTTTFEAPDPCAGDDLAAANTCLADVTACDEQFQNLVTNENNGKCTFTPLP